MCLAIPGEVIELLEGGRARVDVGGVRKDISLALVEGVLPGDYVLVHVGHALSKIDEEEARLTLSLFKEMLEADRREGLA